MYFVFFFFKSVLPIRRSCLTVDIRGDPVASIFFFFKHFTYVEFSWSTVCEASSVFDASRRPSMSEAFAALPDSLELAYIIILVLV